MSRVTPNRPTPVSIRLGRFELPTVAVTADRLAAACPERPVVAIFTDPGMVLYELPAVPGCLWIVHHYDPEHDIADGFVWAPSDSWLTAEHGSVTGEQLAAVGARIAVERPHLPLSDCFALPGGRDDAYGCVFTEL